MKSAFPPISETDEHGILAWGGDYSIELLIDAYSQGIFPWPHPNYELIPWFAPEQRAILRCNKLRGISRTIRYAKSNHFEVRIDTNFEQVMRSCQSVKRLGQEGTWISEEMIKGYIEAHNFGLTHSIEVYQEEELVGGIYGISIGRMFAAESMFHTVDNASKLAFVCLCEIVSNAQGSWIDCQELTDHLESIGGELVPRETFTEMLKTEISGDQITFSKGLYKKY